MLVSFPIYSSSSWQEPVLEGWHSPRRDPRRHQAARPSLDCTALSLESSGYGDESKVNDFGGWTSITSINPSYFSCSLGSCSSTQLSTCRGSILYSATRPRLSEACAEAPGEAPEAPGVAILSKCYGSKLKTHHRTADFASFPYIYIHMYIVCVCIYIYIV